MRPRKRAGWPITVYRYWVSLEHDTWSDLPTSVMHEAEAMRALWNQLVDAFAQHQVAYQEARQVSPDPHPDTESALRSSRSQAFQQLRESFAQEARRLTVASPAAWANRRFILTQFQAAVGRYFRHHGNPPHPKTDTFRQVHFCHQFTAGGLPVERIFGQVQRLHLEPVPPEAFHPTCPQRQRKRLARTSGLFQVGSTSLPFKTILHRPLPVGAYLKTAALVGKQIRTGGYHNAQNGGHHIHPRWQWSLHLTVESPPVIVPGPVQEIAVATLRLEGALWEDTHLRLGMLSDSTGREETLLLPQAILQEWQYKRALQSQADHCLEQTKTQLHNHPERTRLPLTAQRALAQLWAVRAPGLWRLLHTVEEESSVPGILELLRTWADRSTKILWEARGLERRFLGHRDWFYHNLANDLCRHYQQISIVALAMEDTTSETAPNAASYHQFLALSRFVTFLHQAAVKTGTKVRMQPQVSISSEASVDTSSVKRPSSAGKKLKHIVKSVA
jgi:hypothetical protein